MSNRRLFSSREIINALLRGDFLLHRKSKKSHQSLCRPRPHGGYDVTVVPLGKKEIPKGTFDSILKIGDIDLDDFLGWAKVKDKGRRRKRKAEAE